MRKLLTIISMVICFLPGMLNAQTKVITGTVKEKDGALPGAGITEKGMPANATLADANGNFKITLKGSSQVLIIRNIGYQTQEVNVAGNSNVNIMLEADSKGLDEVVVVGYGTQKKVNLTGSVASINAKELNSRPITNVSSALAGLAPGVSVQQGSGKPGSDGATIRIRGTGTLNNNNPLVVIDGIVGTMDAVNPNDIENISVLKDAASGAIYGSLSANGVILITTKKGAAGRNNVTYSGLVSFARPSRLPDFISDYARFMRLTNESNRNMGVSEVYAANTIQKWEEANKDPNGISASGVPNYVAYPNTDWADWVFGKNQLVQNHNIAITGGTDKVSYNLSAGYLDNGGIMKNTGLQKYQIRANVESKINKVLTLGTQTFISTQSVGKANTENAFNFMWQTNPGIYPFYEGKYGFAPAIEEPVTNNNILTYLNGTGGKDKETRINSTLYAIFNLYKGLTLESKVNYQDRYREQSSFAMPIERWDFSTNTLKVPLSPGADLSTSYEFNKNYTLTFDNVLRYQTSIGSHDLSALVGYNQFYYNFYDVRTSKKGLIDYGNTTLGSATDIANTSGGREYDRGMRSWFGRVNYAYKSKYLFEAVLRYDGSSKFATENRFGVFPSFSAGWRVSEEAFMKGLADKIQNLKVRASWGKVGNNIMSVNDDQGNYDYLAGYDKVNYSYNNASNTGLAITKFGNKTLRWESTTVANLGLDLTTFGGRMNLEVDVYQKKTDDILTTPPIYLTAGTAAAPTQNTASMSNKGLEFTLGWKDKIGEVDYSVVGNFAYNFNRVTKYKGKLSEGYTVDANGNRIYSSNIGQVGSGDNTRILEDHTINELYLLQVYNGNGSYKNSDGSPNINGGPKDGMIRTPEDLDWVKSMIAAGYKFNPVGTVAKGQLYYGDLIYADTNGDGVYGNNFDKQFTNASSIPKYTLGLNFAVAWKGFDFSMLWAASTGMKYLYNQSGINSTRTNLGNAIGTRIADDHYYYNDANPNDPANNITAGLPRLKWGSSDNQTNIPSNFWLYNASYLKLKNVQVGYSFSDGLIKKVGLNRLRVYLSGENLLMITKYPGLDPEVGANLSYPTMKQFATGLIATF